MTMFKTRAAAANARFWADSLLVSRFERMEREEEEEGLEEGEEGEEEEEEEGEEENKVSVI